MFITGFPTKYFVTFHLHNDKSFHPVSQCLLRKNNTGLNILARKFSLRCIGFPDLDAASHGFTPSSNLPKMHEIQRAQIFPHANLYWHSLQIKEDQNTKTTISEKSKKKTKIVYQRYCGILMPAKWVVQGLKAFI